MKITVYLGANEGRYNCFRKAAKELGTWIGGRKDAGIYGGSKTGLMGVLAESTLEAGGQVIGVEPDFFVEAEVQHEGLTELIVTKTMGERKEKMIELGDAYLAFPGGTGTLEEIAQVMSLVSLKMTDRPCILYNLNGYYDSLKAQLDRMVQDGLCSKERLEGIYFIEELGKLEEILS